MFIIENDWSDEFLDSVLCHWSSTDYDTRRRWQVTWPIQEFLTSRHNNDIAKPDMKEYLQPILMLNRKFVRFSRKKRR